MMTRRSKIWLVAGVVFVLVNLAGGVMAAAQGELRHAGVHGVLLVLGVVFVRRILRRAESELPDSPRELTDSLSHLEQSMDAIALEVERIGEGQRFITRVITEADSSRERGEGVAEPIEIKAPKATDR